MLIQDSIELWLARLKDHLQKERYSPARVRHYVAVNRGFLTYLKKQHIEIGQANPLDVCSYLKAASRSYRQRYGKSPANQGGWRRSHTSGIHLLLRIAQGRWPPDPVLTSPCEIFHRQLCNDYAQWLAAARGLASFTISSRRTSGLRFLTWLGERGSQEKLPELRLADVDAYMSIRAASFQRSTRKELAGSLRQFLRYLHRQGFLIRDLAPAVTSPSLYALESIPAALRPEEVSAVLQITEKDRTPIGLRDFAILTLLSTYGLRAGEVIGLRLEDVDWRHDRLRVHRSKTCGETLLPLLAPVGSAILRYLRHGRPETAAREVFIHAQAPYRAFRNASSLYVLIARRLKAAGVHPQGRRGSHAFRHARAVSLLRASVPMKTIGDILGHQRSSSTAIYLKLASSDLRSVSLEVPKEVTP